MKNENKSATRNESRVHRFMASARLKKAAILAGVLGGAGAASAAAGDPVSITSMVTSCIAQVQQTASEALPFVGALIAATIVFKVAKRFVK